MRRSRLSHFFVTLGLAATAVMTACAPTMEKKPVLKECVLPDDQAKTLSARWRVLPVAPVPVAFKAGQWSPEEMQDILKAVDTWNAFMTESKGYPAINPLDENGNIRQSTGTRPTSLCSNSIQPATSTGFTGPVVIYKQSRWPYTSTDAIALTSFCPLPANPLPSIYMAMMEVNYQNFFVDGQKLPDLNSIFVHEFGHLMGLDHSCDTKNKAGFPNCNDPSMPQDYYDAVMFPIVLFDAQGFGEPRRQLLRNDQGRANCLYQDG